MPSANKRNVIIGATALVTLMLAMRLRSRRTQRKNATNSAVAAATVAERFEFPVVVNADTHAALGLTLGAPCSVPPRLTASSVLGMPEDASNPVKSACIVVDAMSRIVGGHGNNNNNNNSSLHRILTADCEDEAELLSSVRSYVLSSCPFTAGTPTHESVVCRRIANTPASMDLTVPRPQLSAEEQNSPKLKAVAMLKAQQSPIKVIFGFEVFVEEQLIGGEDGASGQTAQATTVYVCVVPEAHTVISLIVVTEVSAGGGNAAAHASDATDISTALKSAFSVLRPSIGRLAATAAAGPLTIFDVHSADNGSPFTTSGVIVTNAAAKFRAVLPTIESTVEDIRCPAVAGTVEVLITVNGLVVGCTDKCNTSSNDNNNNIIIKNNFVRITFHDTMPSTWEDEKAIVDVTEKAQQLTQQAVAQQHTVAALTQTQTQSQSQVPFQSQSLCQDRGRDRSLS